jgi:hypothetical protein
MLRSDAANAEHVPDLRGFALIHLVAPTPRSLSSKSAEVDLPRTALKYDMTSAYGLLDS